MAAHTPPVPPANRTTKGPGQPAADPKADPKPPKAPENTEEQGRQGNIHQNTTHPGQQQDR
jgi:hypothetical protein